ncbi:hypothetical protein [Paraflavitalea sp. CAU 1676]|nr:hypothetical protein [Paraflavitalea sp. CAU 1676]MDF2192168.1 hypothetical protein [Paraflavitalea sp. CAU 1676]
MNLTPTQFRPLKPIIYQVLLNCLEECTQHNGDQPVGDKARR